MADFTIGEYTISHYDDKHLLVVREGDQGVPLEIEDAIEILEAIVENGD